MRYVNSDIAALFETSLLKKVGVLRYLHNKSALLMPKFQNKDIVYLLDKLFKLMLRLRFLLSFIFYTFLNIRFFFEKLKASKEACFLYAVNFINRLVSFYKDNKVKSSFLK